jgi:hypothetical protein
VALSSELAFLITKNLSFKAEGVDNDFALNFHPGELFSERLNNEDILPSLFMDKNFIYFVKFNFIPTC